jgi:hypothetical protein
MAAGKTICCWSIIGTSPAPLFHTNVRVELGSSGRRWRRFAISGTGRQRLKNSRATCPWCADHLRSLSWALILAGFGPTTSLNHRATLSATSSSIWPWTRRGRLMYWHQHAAERALQTKWRACLNRATRLARRSRERKPTGHRKKHHA